MPLTKTLKTASRFISSLALCAAASLSHAAPIVFDNMHAFETGNPNAKVAATGSMPNTYMGAGYQLKAGTKSISGFDFYAANISNLSFTGLKIGVWVWDSVRTANINTSNPAFADLLGSYSFTTGPMNLTTGTYAVVNQNLGTQLALNDDVIGITFNVQGTVDGVNYSNVNGLTTLITSGTTPDVGASLFEGYLRNANGETNGNFTSAIRTLSGLTQQGLAVRIYGNDVLDNQGNTVPEPASWLLLGIGMVLMVNLRRKAH